MVDKEKKDNNTHVCSLPYNCPHGRCCHDDGEWLRTYDNDESVGKRKFRSFIRRNVKMSDDASHLSF